MIDELVTSQVDGGSPTKTVEIPLTGALGPWAGEILPMLLDELRQEYPRLTFSVVLDRSWAGRRPE
jgi:hypothetical protein